MKFLKTAVCFACLPAAKQGGFIWTKAPTPVTILGSALVNNYGQAGGAVFVSPHGK